jgi:hypothetical protein
MDILRDPIWQSISVFAAVFFALLSLRLLLKQCIERILGFDIEDPIPLISEHLKAGPLKILYGECEIDNAYMCSVVFSNTGNTKIKRDNFDGNLSVELTDNGQVVSRDITDQVPQDTLDIKCEISSSFKSVIFEPFVLNKNEEFTLKLLIINGNPKIKAKAHMIEAQLKPFKYAMARSGGGVIDFLKTGFDTFDNLMTGKGLVSRKRAG